MDQLKDILGQGFGEKVLDYMKEMAKGIGVAAEHVYEVLVRQQIAYGFALMVGCSIGLILLYLGIRWIWKQQQKDDGFSRFFGTAIFIAGTIICLINVFNGFMHVFNPEYYAMQEIINAISSANK